MTYQEIWQSFHSVLEKQYKQLESNALFFTLWMHNTGKPRLSFDEYRNQEVKDVDLWADQIKRMQQGEPIQYVINKAEFLGLNVHVTPDVLIPRPETEELVSLILAENEAGAKNILDIGTGSGCIPLAIKQSRPAWQVHAVDVSDGALCVAKLNAQKLDLKVRFHQADICNWNTDERFDIIISNPPYIPEQEKDSLEINVRKYEPDEALFVPDNDPLLFYKCIADFAETHLIKPEGKLYFESHYKYAQQVCDLFSKQTEAQVLTDMFGKQRFVVVYY
jgi:release factor glutamine methyltransferase